MKVYIAADHAGLRMKAALLSVIEGMGHDVEDMGAYSLDPTDDYPDFVAPLARRVAEEPGVFGIVCAGSGQGEAMCANRIEGARAAVCYALVKASEALDTEGAHSEDGYDVVRLARRHIDANILSIGSRFLSAHEATEAVRVFLSTPFSGDERHIRRIAKF